jgi:hypothetical protein
MIVATDTIHTLLVIITVGLLTTGKNKNRENMTEFLKIRHIIPVVNLPTSDQPFNFKIAKITEI